MNLNRLDQPPITLEGAALIILDLVDGRRDTNAIVAYLSERYPDERSLDEQVRTCLCDLSALGIIVRLAPSFERCLP